MRDQRRRWRASGATLAVVALLAPACAQRGGADDARLRAVTTVSPITSIVQSVGGDRVRVTGLVPEGIDSHTFEPAPGDARVLAEADVVFGNGLNLEVPTLELARTAVPEGTPIVLLAEETIAPQDYVYDETFPREGGDPNPHLWTNPPYARRYAEIVRETLRRLDPAGARTYDRAFRSFARRVDELDRLVRAATATVPPGNRKLLTYHDSFPYFARQYGWEVVGAVQPSDFSEPSPRDVAALIEQVRDEEIPAIFGSEVFPSGVLEQIARETGVRYVDDLRDDDLPGEPGDPDHSYLGMMVFNLRTMVEALGGDPTVFEGFDVRDASEDERYR